MKLFLPVILLLLALLGCKRQHVYHTFYGTIDTDTLEAVENWEDSQWYPVVTTALEDTVAHAMGLSSMWEIIYYSPAQDKYFFELYGSDGGSSSRITFDPKDGKKHTYNDYIKHNK